MKVSIISADVQLLNRWRGGLVGKVHSVYSHAAYLSDSSGRLFCLTTADQQDGPGIARVSLPSFTECAAMALQPGDTFSVVPSIIRSGRFECDFSQCKEWDRSLPVFPSADALPNALSIAKRVLISEGREGGYKYFFQQTEVKSDLFSRALQQRAEFLLTALKQRQFAAVQTHGCSLIGLGHGLTPSGDDFLAALITVFYLPDGPFPEECRQIGQYWASAADSSTTAVGAFLLHTAAEGRAREPVSDFIAAMANSHLDAIPQAARQVLAFGSSSGTDWLAGLIAGLEAGV